MAQSDRSPKGKGKGKKSHDYDTQSISLSDCHDYYTSPRVSCTDPLATGSQVLPTGQPYSQSDNYYTDTSGHVYASTGTASGQAWSNVDSLSVSPHVMLVNEADGYATPIASCRASSSYSANWDVYSSNASECSNPFSQGPASSVASSAPPRYSRDNVNSNINQQPAALQRYELPCEIRGCTSVFHGDEMDEWTGHTEGHLGGTFPSKLRCWFDCDFDVFDARSLGRDGNHRYNFMCRMEHIRDHIINDGLRPYDRAPDGFLIDHLRKQGIIDEQAYRDWLRPPRVPPVLAGSRPGSGAGDHGSSTYYTYLPVVEEEAGPSRSRDRRHEKKSEKKEHKRDSHHRKKPTK